MADPLSITASIIALFQGGNAVNKGVKKLLSLRNAPAVLEELQDEARSLHRIVVALNEELWERRTWSPVSQETRKRAATDNLVDALRRAEAVVVELQGLVEYSLTKPGSSQTIDWVEWLRCSKETERIVKRVARAKQTILEALSVENFVARQMLETDMHRRFDQSTQRTEALITQVSAVFASTYDTKTLEHRSIEAPDEVLPLTESNEPAAQSLQLMSTDDTAIDDFIPHKPHESGLIDRQQYSSSQRFQTTWIHTCATSFCRCVCHKRRKLQSPEYLAKTLGALRVVYTAFPFMMPTCDVLGCKRDGSASTVSYQLPKWLSGATLRSRFQNTANGGPELLLRVYRTRPFNGPFFRAILRGDVELLQAILRNGTGSLLDVTPDGESPLHVAFLNTRAKRMVDFLLDIGADIHQEDHRSRTPHQEHCLLSLRSNRYTEWISPLRSALEIERLGITDLQASIIGLQGAVPFGTAYEKTSRETINDQDYNGYTALCWAILMSQRELVTKLLQKGADPNIADWKERTPLMMCFMYLDNPLPVARALCDAGADVHCLDFIGDNLWSYAVYDLTFGRFDEMYDFLVECDIKMQYDRRGSSHLILLLTALEDQCALLLVQKLKRRGFLFESSLFDKHSFLYLVAERSNATLEFLLENIEEPFGTEARKCILYDAAGYGDRDTLRVLSKFDAGSFDTSFRDAWGKSAMTMAVWRKSKNSRWAVCTGSPIDPDPEAWYEDFYDLWSRVHEANTLEAAAAMLRGELLMPETDQNEEDTVAERATMPGAFPKDRDEESMLQRRGKASHE